MNVAYEILIEDISDSVMDLVVEFLSEDAYYKKIFADMCHEDKEMYIRNEDYAFLRVYVKDGILDDMGRVRYSERDRLSSDGLEELLLKGSANKGVPSCLR